VGFVVQPFDAGTIPKIDDHIVIARFLIMDRLLEPPRQRRYIIPMGFVLGRVTEV
jgi:hypothetical protein